MKRLLFLFWLLPSLALAAPSISSISGAVTNQSTITISGTGFGASGIPYQTSYDNSDTGENWSGGTLSGSDWAVSGSPSPAISTTATRGAPLPQSSYSVAIPTQYTGGSDYHSLRHTYITTPGKYYVSWWVYRDYTSWDITTAADNMKWFRPQWQAGAGGDLIVGFRNQTGTTPVCLNTTAEGTPDAACYPAGQPGCPTIAATAMSAGFYSSQRYDVNAQNSIAGASLQTWEHYEYYMEINAVPGEHTGTGMLWKDGRLHHRVYNVTFDYADTVRDRIFTIIGGNISSGRTTAGYDYIDQVYLSTTPARVFISDDPNLGGTTHGTWPDIDTANHSEIQVCSSWSASEIQFTVNRGTFGATDTAYLYVVDSNNDISSAYEITFGDEEEGEPEAPPTLSNVTISGVDFQ